MDRCIADLGYLVREIPPYTLVCKQTLPGLPALLASERVLGRELPIAGRASIRIIEPDLVVRRLLHGGLFRHLTGPRFLSTRRSVRELKVQTYLLANRIPTPEIVALRFMKRGLFYSIEVISRMVHGSVDLLTLLEQGRGHALSLLEKTGGLVRDVHGLGVYHTDLHVKNILIDASGNPWIIDLDNAYCFRRLPSVLRRRNVGRFLHSLRKWESRKRISLPADWELAFLSGYSRKKDRLSV